MPPKNPPEEITEDEFTEYLSTEAGRKYLEAYRTSKGVGIGTYEELVKHPYEVWKKQQRVKYAAYYESCISGNNEMGKKLKTGQDVEEIYPIDTWREMRRLYGFEIIVAGSKPSGYGQKKKKDIPKSAYADDSGREYCLHSLLIIGHNLIPFVWQYGIIFGY